MRGPGNKEQACLILPVGRQEGSDQGADAGDAEDEDADDNSISNIRGLLQVRHCSGCLHILSHSILTSPIEVGLLFLFYK